MEVLNTQLLRLFDWLLWVSLQGTVLIVLIVLIQIILRRRLPVRWHYFLWLLLPQGILETYGLEELRYVFIHELAHLKQRDIYLGWLMALLQVVHWFNPLMWFAFGRMRADREIACDRLAISTMGPDEPPKYGRTIVSLLESFSQVRYLPSVAGILEDTCQMERRIKMIADYKKTSRPRWAGAMLLLAVLACVVLTNALCGQGRLRLQYSH